MIKKILVALFLWTILSWCSSAEENIVSEVQKWEIMERNILALWDSLTAGYNLDLSDGYPAQLEALMQDNWYNYSITNAGVSWDTSKNLLDRIELYDDLKVDIYLLTIWANDGLRRQSVESMKKNISTIIEHIQIINPDSQIVLSGMQMPINLWLNYSRDFNSSYEIISEKYKLELYDFLLEDVAKKSELNLSDWIHPNKKWYAIIANNLYKFLENENIITQ
jgi:acyl-CoA thioesterase-1